MAFNTATSGFTVLCTTGGTLPTVAQNTGDKWHY